MQQKTPEQLIHTYGDMVYRLAYAQTRTQSDADDVFQEVFLRLIRRKPQFESESHEKAWLLRVTLNCSKNHWGAAWRRHTAPLDDRIPVSDPALRELDEALQKLPSSYRAVLHLFYYEGYAAEEIAVMLGQKPSAVRTRLTRARQKLRETLKGDL